MLRPGLPRVLAVHRNVVVAVFVGVGVIAIASVLGRFFLWNLSPSLPRGLYLRDPSSAPRRGAVVSFAPPADAAAVIAARGYLPPGVSLLKLVVALSGDTVCIDRATFRVNGKAFGVLAARDSAGRSLVPFAFCGVVPTGRAFVATPAPMSFDSRYFGPVALSTLTVAVPVWTF
jgi:conjugative transfer signal peptidase TraF